MQSDLIRSILFNLLNRNFKKILRDEARSPLSIYPTDQYGPTYWNRYGGLGQLTAKGLLQSYNFGQYLKNYYINFLTPSYMPSKVYARSIDIDRSLMTANSFLSGKSCKYLEFNLSFRLEILFIFSLGMYPPATSDQLWSPSVTWFPIPIHTTNLYDDHVCLFFYFFIEKFHKEKISI